MTEFDFGEFVPTGIEDAMVRFAQDVSALAAVVLAEIDRRLVLCAQRFADHEAPPPQRQSASLEAAARGSSTRSAASIRNSI